MFIPKNRNEAKKVQAVEDSSKAIGTLLGMVIGTFLIALIYQWYSYLWFPHTLPYVVCLVLSVIGCALAYTFKLVGRVFFLIMVASIFYQVLVWFHVFAPHLNKS